MEQVGLKANVMCEQVWCVFVFMCMETFFLSQTGTLPNNIAKQFPDCQERPRFSKPFSAGIFDTCIRSPHLQPKCFDAQDEIWPENNPYYKQHCAPQEKQTLLFPWEVLVNRSILM